jgi:rRNA maturation endonuclease Nob1
VKKKKLLSRGFKYQCQGCNRPYRSLPISKWGNQYVPACKECGTDAIEDIETGKVVFNVPKELLKPLPQRPYLK